MMSRADAERVHPGPLPQSPIIRLAAPGDAAALAAIYAPAVTQRVTSFELVAPDADEMARRVATIVARTPWLVCTHAGTVAGYAYAGPHRERAAYQWSVEVSAYVRPHRQRAGVARALYTSLIALLVLQGFRNAYAGIALPNAASVGFHEALGFSLIGVHHGAGYKMGAWHDVAWFERSLAPRSIDPEPRVPLPALVGTPAFTEALATGLPSLRLAAR